MQLFKVVGNNVGIESFRPSNLQVAFAAVMNFLVTEFSTNPIQMRQYFLDYRGSAIHLIVESAVRRNLFPSSMDIAEFEAYFLTQGLGVIREQLLNGLVVAVKAMNQLDMNYSLEEISVEYFLIDMPYLSKNYRLEHSYDNSRKSLNNLGRYLATASYLVPDISNISLATIFDLFSISSEEIYNSI